MPATAKGLRNLARAILRTRYTFNSKGDHDCDDDDARMMLLALLGEYSDPDRVVQGRPEFEIGISSAALSSSAKAHREHAIPLHYIASTMLAEAAPGNSGLEASMLNMNYSLYQVIMLATEHAVLNKSKAMKQSMPANWNGSDIFVRYGGAKGIAFSGATRNEYKAYMTRLNKANGAAKAAKTKAEKKLAAAAVGAALAAPSATAPAKAVAVAAAVSAAAAGQAAILKAAPAVAAAEAPKKGGPPLFPAATAAKPKMGKKSH